jgi:hypothetical protein
VILHISGITVTCTSLSKSHCLSSLIKLKLYVMTELLRIYKQNILSLRRFKNTKSKFAYNIKFGDRQRKEYCLTFIV